VTDSSVSFPFCQSLILSVSLLSCFHVWKLKPMHAIHSSLSVLLLSEAIIDLGGGHAVLDDVISFPCFHPSL